ncbi:MAG: glycosyltransferase [Euryarchaeota archaeon]|jgi:glycosyltransferase involved in cell wall biosynthesis|nr:glycosyltransferase [Euryarchaeota archaeon]
MVRDVLLARGGASGAASGLGRAHHDLVKVLDSNNIEGYAVGGVIEHELGGNPAKRINRRWRSHPKRVQNSLAMMDLLHITDQEQAHLVPENCPIPVSVTVHDLFHLFPRITEGVEVGEQKPGKIRKKDLEKLHAGLARADLLICDSNATLMEVREHFPNVNSICVPLGLTLEERSPESNPLSKPTWLEGEGKHLLLVGSEEPRKRLDFAIRACRGLSGTILHKIGAESNSDAEKQLKALAAAHGVDLRWQGRVSEGELQAAWQHADGLLFPSIAEGFGYPPLEAMAGGCRVLVADVGSANEIPLTDSLLPVDDVMAWNRAIKELPTGRCAESLKRAEEFSSQKFAQNMAKAFDSLF